MPRRLSPTVTVCSISGGCLRVSVRGPASTRPVTMLAFADLSRICSAPRRPSALLVVNNTTISEG